MQLIVAWIITLQRWKGEKLIKSLKRHVKQDMDENQKKRKKLHPFFNINNQRKLEHINDLTYLLKCPREICSKNYLRAL